MEKHVPVLLTETIELLNLKKDGIYIDCTLGRAGHSSKILKFLGNKGMLYCFEQDKEAIKESEVKLEKISNNFKIIRSNFKNLEAELFLLNIKKVDGILYDLGVSSPQLDVSSRGFSYHQNDKLDMRMDDDQKLKAWDVVNEYPLNSLTKIFREYGEDKFAYQIAKNIIKYRTLQEINTTFELVDIIKKSLPQKILRKSKHPAKKIFQAIRIEVNDEMNVLKTSLHQALNILNPNGRIVVISFHSLEDRITKKIFNSKIKNPDEEINKVLPMNIKEWKSEYKLVNKKIIIPSLDEININRRSRSAKLRAIEKL